MGTAKDLGRDYLESEISKSQSRLTMYIDLYSISDIKSLMLKRMINVKKEELHILETLLCELAEKE